MQASPTCRYERPRRRRERTFWSLAQRVATARSSVRFTIPVVCQAAQNALAGAQHTELVVIGIGHDHPIDLALADVDSSRPKRNEAVYLRSLINVVGRSDVEMQPVLPDLRGKRRTPG